MDPETNTIELHVSANAVVINQPVDLEMILPGCCILKELDRAKTEVFVDGEPVGAGDVTVSQDDPNRFTWKGSADLGQHTIRVDVADKDGNTATGEAVVYVIPFSQAQIIVTSGPDENGSVELKVEFMHDQAARKTAAKAAPARSLNDEEMLRGAGLRFSFDTPAQGTITRHSPMTFTWHAIGAEGAQRLRARLTDNRGRPVQKVGGGPLTAELEFAPRGQPTVPRDTFRVALQRSSTLRTSDEGFWPYIRTRTLAISSERFAEFVQRVLAPQPGYSVGPPRSGPTGALSREARDMRGCNYGAGAYELLKTAAQVFLLLECGGALRDEVEPLDLRDESDRAGRQVSLEEIGTAFGNYLGGAHLPYIERVLNNAFRGEPRINSALGYGVLHSRIHCPCLIELIWSYWHEEGMLVQTMNAITRRFQNVRAPFDRDPLAHLEIDPLRPLNNLLWGYIQDEWNRLSVKRRAYEYDHHYGLTVYGKAVPGLRPADSRSKFLEAFHTLLHLVHVFYKEDNDTTVIADGFPLLNALKEVHMLLAQGAHNQFGDLPWTARAEMLIQQWLLSRPEMRDFLQSRPMVPYKEAWMAPVDTMKTLQGWSDTSVTHFRDLGVYGEQVLLSIRWADWIGINNEDSAKNWARSWRPEIQGYIHAYRAATGADLTNPDGVDHALPAVHLRKRLAMQRSR